MSSTRVLPLAALAIALLLSACNYEGTPPEIGVNDDAETESPLDAQPLVIFANAVGGTSGVDTVFTRGPMFATLMVTNPHGAEVGHLDVTVSYEFSELSDSVDFVAPGVFQLAEPEILKPAESGSVTIRVGPADTGSVEVPLGTPRSLTKMSATRFFLLTDANVTSVRTVGTDSLNASALIRTATNERSRTKITDFGHLGFVYGGIVLPSLVPGDVRLVGGTLVSTSILEGSDETVWDYTKPAGATARIEFDVFNQAPFTVPAGVPWVISYDAPQPLVTENNGTVWPQVVVAQGATGAALAPGESITIDAGVSSQFTEDPQSTPEYVLIVDTESVARVYPILLAGRAVRGWLNVRDDGAP